MGNMNEFILYVLRDNKQLSVIDIFDEIDKIPCEKPWSNEAITPKNSCSSCCYRMYVKNILDRDKSRDGPYIYWII